MIRLRSIVIAGLLALGASYSPAWSQCQGNPPAGRICANGTAAPTLPSWYTQSVVLDRNFGAPSGQGTILNRGASLWSATATPSLGLNGTAGGSLTLNGSSTGSAVLGVKAAAGTVTFNLPITNGSLNNVLITDGSGNTSWTTAGAGTVSSVGLSMPGIFTVTNSPVTGTGTLTATLNTQSANAVWAGPTIGAASAPTFRALVGADLPNPSASTLGGIQSTTGVTHQWISTISTFGVPGLTQPAFTDISGALSPTQCPNPSPSTVGCIESYAAVSHQWINTISIAGVPSSTQPAFTDISGQTSLAQLPGIGSNTVLSNISGGTATPLANSLTAIIDSAIGSTQGDVLYRNGTIWTVLAPGSNGQVLTSAGAAANPTWTTVTGTGTVTSIATNNGITGGTITTTGTIGLATISTGDVLANVTGGSAAPTATTPSAVLDTIGSTEGSVLYRGASTWLALTPGTNGQFLQTTGASSTPTWAGVTVTAPGTGGITQTISAKANQQLSVYDYGAKCDGSTNDITAFNNAATEAVALNQELVIPGGTCVLGSQWVLPGIIKIRGQGPFSSIIQCAANIVCILSTVSSGPWISDLQITAPSGTGSNLQIGDATHAVNYANVRNVVFGVSGTALLLENVGTSYIVNNWFNGGYSAAAIQISSPLNVDGGDALIDGNWMIGTSSTIGVQHISGGGWKIANNKMVTNQYGYGMFATLGGAVTSSVIITGNSIEGCTQACIAFSNNSSLSGSLTHVVISNNQGGAGSAGFFIDLVTNTRSWISDVVISGNQGLNVSGNSCIFVDSTATFSVTGNTCSDDGTPTGAAYVFGALATVGGASGNMSGGGFTAAKRWTTTSGSTVIIDDVIGVPVANLPANANIGSRIVATDGAQASTPCTGSSSGTLAIRVAGGFKCF